MAESEFKTKFRAKVTVMFRKSILDPQGAAVERALKSHTAGDISFPEISSVRVGKVIELTIDGIDAGADAGSVEEKIKILADRILANPVMEEYTVAVEPL
ncbi:MAG: phosphoribosylformylglycinamidine synthase subunit PurS [Synergistaceae bacterium]|jgi:phosphoribosylformylglycinamidine synthase|nr:phosphoribosylformylglycinamidine synthase subunit PurS [Synergistaceae bacterium]